MTVRHKKKFKSIPGADGVSGWERSPDTAAAVAAKFLSTPVSEAAVFADSAKLRCNMLTGGNNRRPSKKTTAPTVVSNVTTCRKILMTRQIL